MTARTLSAVLALAAAATLGACGGGNDDAGDNGGTRTGTATSPPATSASVSATDSLTFDPKSVRVAMGGTVEWKNTGTLPHNVTFKDGSFSKPLAKGATVTYSAAKAGSYPYTCTLHPGMDGTVVVV